MYVIHSNPGGLRYLWVRHLGGFLSQAAALSWDQVITFSTDVLIRVVQAAWTGPRRRPAAGREERAESRKNTEIRVHIQSIRVKALTQIHHARSHLNLSKRNHPRSVRPLWSLKGPFHEKLTFLCLFETSLMQTLLKFQKLRIELFYIY